MVAPLRPGETALGGRQKGDGYAAVGRSTSQAWFGSGFSNAPVTCWCRNGEIDLGEVENTSMGEAIFRQSLADYCNGRSMSVYFFAR